MIHELHGTLQRLLYEKGRVSPDDVDVRFDAPRREWVTSLIRPTLNFFLFDVRENTDLRSTNLQSTKGNGVTQFRLPPRRFDLRFMVSAITTMAEDEHHLLWRAMVTLLKFTDIPRDLLAEPLLALDPPLVAQVVKPEEDGLFLDIWSGLESSPRPALLYVVTAPVELDITFQAPLVFTRTMRYLRTRDTDRPIETGVHIGGVVLDRAGHPLPSARVSIDGRARAEVATDPDGRFVLPGVDAGPVTLRITREGKPPKVVTLAIPSDTYEIVLD